MIYRFNKDKAIFKLALLKLVLTQYMIHIILHIFFCDLQIIIFYNKNNLS